MDPYVGESSVDWGWQHIGRCETARSVSASVVSTTLVLIARLLDFCFTKKDAMFALSVHAFVNRIVTGVADLKQQVGWTRYEHLMIPHGIFGI